MQIKKRHVQMARAAWRCFSVNFVFREEPEAQSQLRFWIKDIGRWHRAAKGKHR